MGGNKLGPAWNRAVDPLGGGQVGNYRKILSMFQAETPNCLGELKSTDCEAMIQELMDLKRALYPADDRIIRLCALTPPTDRQGRLAPPTREGTRRFMKRKLPKPKKTADEASPTADRTLHIEWPWSMTWMEYVDEMLAFLKSQVGPGHPLHRRKLYVAAVNKKADAWYVEGEKDDFYAIIYFRRRKRYGGKMMPLAEILPDWDAVLRRFAEDTSNAQNRL